MAHMDARLAPLHLRLGLAASALLGASALIAGALAAAPPTPAPVSAAGPVYNIEIIVFQATATLGGAENWSAEAGAGTHSIVAGDESASGAAQVGHFVAMLPASVWQLTDLENRLRASGGYGPPAHVAWSPTASSSGTRARVALPRLWSHFPGLRGTEVLHP